MKKIILILWFSFAGLAVFPQIHISSTIEGGYEQRNVVIYKDYPYYYFQKSMFFDADFTAKWKGFSAYTGTCTYFTYRKVFAYVPIQSDYNIGLRYNFNRFEINVDHLCSHSIEGKRFRDGWNRISIKYQIIK